MRRFKKIIKWLLIAILTILLLPIIFFAGLYLYFTADMGEPNLQFSAADYTTHKINDTLFCKDSYLKQDSTGLWELYITGSGQEKGAKQGLLTKELMKFQEDVFINQIREIIPSDKYLSFLRTFIVIFNRNLGEYVPIEYRNEIVALSEFCTDEYNAIGSPYERQLNYHAAHDIGHAMQQYMLVGCSSFGDWQNDLIIGRNFDFYVGDDFAKNRIITFATPDKGYKYASIGWAAMVGVLSGMNETGLTVTINAAKGAMPTSAAMPISLLAREILQYASTIEEAYKIAEAHEVFVSESLLIGSLKDGKAAIIEKTPKKMALYETTNNKIVCTNHYQSSLFAQDSYNVENIEFSDSKYRYNRLAELLNSYDSINPENSIEILRNRYGMGGKDVGVGNEMTLNQSIAHHSVVFLPKDSRMWVSTSPWQSGKFICYDMQKFFAGKGYPERIFSKDLAEDSAFINNDYQRLLDYRIGVKNIKQAMSNSAKLSADFIADFKTHNPQHYYTYRILGDYYLNIKDNATAVNMYNLALQCEIPYKSERVEIEQIINTLQQ